MNNKLTANQIRRKWLDFFVKNDHFELESVSLIPINDTTLLWINSGVATLKNYFSGKENPPHVNLTNSQKAIRTNDIFNVGVTARHHTFFEMLGNFSVGGYFKEEAIELAFNFLTKELMFDINKLYFTVYKEDEIAYNKWISLGVDKKHIIKCDRNRNFWDVGAGPCGPCTEIYYDRGEKYDPKNIGEKLFFDDIENDRYVEIWNIVFSEFNNDGKNNYTPLKRKNIDTGAGLERLCSIIQDVPTNFDSDLFIDIIKSVEQFTNKKYDIESYFRNDLEQSKINLAYKVIADHARALVMAIADGAVPSNKDRGYILRRLIRRIVVKQHFLNIDKNIFDTLVNAVVQTMKEYYPYLLEKQDRIISILNNEYNIFQKTLKLGFKLFDDSAKIGNLDKNTTFKLVETYGFPIELIQELANEHNLEIDINGFNELFKQHQLISNGKKDIAGMEQQNAELLNLNTPFQFLYDTYEINDATILKLYDDNFVPKNEIDGSGWVVFDKTCFYATSGGQMHDIGFINHSFEVDDVIKGPNLQHIHHVINVSSLKEGEKCLLQIDKKNRQKLTNNHSVEHLLHITLVKHIDSSIKQEGAFKSPEKVTFDFQYHKKITKDDIKKIENVINGLINDSISSEILFLELEEAKKLGAMAYFEDVYKKIKGKLRVVKIGDISIELCGGTHVNNTKEIESFKIIDCYQKGAGNWRIEAITTNETISNYIDNKNQQINSKIDEIRNELLKMNISSQEMNSLFDKINKIDDLDSRIELLKDISDKFNSLKLEFNKENAKKQISFVKNQISTNKNNIIIEQFNDIDNKNLFNALSECVNEQQNKIFVLINYIDQKTQYFIACNDKFAKDNNVNLNNLIKEFNAKFNGKGGGKPNFVQGGCSGKINLDDIKNICQKYV